MFEIKFFREILLKIVEEYRVKVENKQNPVSGHYNSIFTLEIRITQRDFIGVILENHRPKLKNIHARVLTGVIL